MYASAQVLSKRDAFGYGDSSRPTRIACVMDIDNICHRGFNRRAGWSYPRAKLDLQKLSGAVQLRGIQRGTACRNYTFLPHEARLWQQTNLKLCAVNVNCDDAVMLAAIDYVFEGLDWLILIGGDGDYLPLVEAVQAAGTFVEVWGCKGRVARSLLSTADCVRFVDDMFVRKNSARKVATGHTAKKNHGSPLPVRRAA